MSYRPKRPPVVTFTNGRTSKALSVEADNARPHLQLPAPPRPAPSVFMDAELGESVRHHKPEKPDQGKQEKSVKKEKIG